MKKRVIACVLAVSMLPLVSSCGKTQDTTQTVTGCAAGCTCTDCPCCGTQNQTVATIEDAQQVLGLEPTSEVATEVETTQEQTTENITTQAATEVTTEASSEQEETYVNEIAQLSEEEKQAREQELAALQKARETLYALPNSKEKTEKINLYDKQILDNNTFDFSTKRVVFIGDSITEGVTATVDQNGNRVSYVTYANSYLKFGYLLNHGKGGRMFSYYGGEELSLNANFSNIINNSADVIVVFAGVNDYLSGGENKRYGDITNKDSDAGYCGAVRYFMKSLKNYFADREIFFVTMYNVDKKPSCTYSDVSPAPTLNDYMQVQRDLAKEYGFHVIELYNTGFLDGTDKASSEAFLADGLHPDDTGNIVLGEHIAAELVLYFSQKY